MIASPACLPVARVQHADRENAPCLSLFCMGMAQAYDQHAVRSKPGQNTQACFRSDSGRCIQTALSRIRRNCGFNAVCEAASNRPPVYLLMTVSSRRRNAASVDCSHPPAHVCRQWASRPVPAPMHRRAPASLANREATGVQLLRRDVR